MKRSWENGGEQPFRTRKTEFFLFTVSLPQWRDYFFLHLKHFFRMITHFGCHRCAFIKIEHPVIGSIEFDFCWRSFTLAWYPLQGVRLFFVSRFFGFFLCEWNTFRRGNTLILGCSATIKNAIVIFNSPGGVNFGEYWRNAFMRFVKSVRTMNGVYRE